MPRAAAKNPCSPRNENGARGGISAASAARIHALEEQNRSIAGVTAISRSKSSASAARSISSTSES
jgi:hypothetical protein